MRAELEGVDPSTLDLNRKAQLFAEGVAGLAQALEIHPVDFIAMLNWITDTAKEALGECTCGHCIDHSDKTKH